MADAGHNSGLSGERLKSFIQRIERLEEDKAAVCEDIKQVYSEAKGTGFDVKIIRAIVKLRKMDVEKRAEYEALLDMYKAAIGMLDGTPLGAAAIARLTKKPVDDEEDADDGMASHEHSDGAESADDDAPKLTSEEEIEKARDAGRFAAEQGMEVTRNPYPAHDKCRAAWDEGWCQAAGSDGMDIPDAWKPTKKPKKPADDAGADAGEAK